MTQLCAVACMVRQEGLEPPTFWFVARHSIQLSYWRECEYYNITPPTGLSTAICLFFYFSLAFCRINFHFAAAAPRPGARLTIAFVRATLTVTTNAMNRFSPVGYPFSESCRLVQGSSGPTGHPLGAAGRITVGLAGRPAVTRAPVIRRGRAAAVAAMRVVPRSIRFVSRLPWRQTRLFCFCLPAGQNQKQKVGAAWKRKLQ